MARQITAINTPTKTLTFTPALSNTVCSNAVNAACATSADCLSPGTCVTATTQASRILANWGNNTIVTEDLRLTGSSPLLDAGTNTPLFGTVPTVDYDDFPRPADGDQNGSPIVDIGAFEFHLPDGDGDGVPDSLDCAPTVNSVWTVPDQVPAPLAIAVGQVLSWMHVPQANVYDVYSGTITTPFTFGPACLITEVPGLSASIAGSNPPVGSAYYYLVGGVNTCGSGPIHSFSTVFPPSTCPPLGAQTDGDGILDINDNCPTVYNVNQADSDHDTVGTACDDCPSLYNPSQLDVNANGVGDDCEDVDGDGYPLVNDCNDGNPAIHPGATEVCNGLDDNCVNGVDEGGASLCVDANVCTQDVCGGTLGCQHPPVADGTTCDDASLCTPTDSCQSGVCVGGNPVICTSPDACHDPGTCAPATGVCSPPTPKPDGTACDDGNACTAPDTCQSGTCQPGGPRDADSDGHPDPLCGGNDCNDLNPLVWAAPAEVTNLILTTVSPANPAWDSQASLAGPETVYDLVSGSMGPGSGLNFAGGSCLLAEGPNSYSDSRPDPALGTAYWYLSRAENSCGVGTYGTPSRDSGILACP
ncbi:MAG: hypothetical protein DMH00_06365 [Acidobacteria bacterium]|nr:MAG: hypothetical protein DMH00_06365 [Acidobacteriota bacterium]